jgi:hypothetical protein
MLQLIPLTKNNVSIELLLFHLSTKNKRIKAEGTSIVALNVTLG